MGILNRLDPAPFSPGFLLELTVRDQGRGVFFTIRCERFVLEGGTPGGYLEQMDETGLVVGSVAGAVGLGGGSSLWECRASGE